MLKDYRFWFGMVFGYATDYLLDIMDWPIWISIMVLVGLFFAAQYLVHKIAES